MTRALIHSLDRVLAEEPTGNLDTHTGETLFVPLRKLNQERRTAFVIVPHNEILPLDPHRSWPDKRNAARVP